jgi:rhodanese-related sulfurtransferase
VSVPEVDTVEGRELVTSGAFLLDVREADEWVAGHAPEAQFLPLRELPARIDQLPRDRRIVAVCRSGARSGRATEFLNARGFDVVNLAGGMQAWEAAGFPVETDDGSPGTVA